MIAMPSEIIDAAIGRRAGDDDQVGFPVAIAIARDGPAPEPHAEIDRETGIIVGFSGSAAAARAGGTASTSAATTRTRGEIFMGFGFDSLKPGFDLVESQPRAPASGAMTARGACSYEEHLNRTVGLRTGRSRRK